MANKLAMETSPYLLQHAENPVDWFPWGEEAFEKAVLEKKPILLSVGYSTCHWCHVMAHESFENKEIAELMNNYFVNIKVDREERPDVDSLYMSSVQALTGQGGWPMTVFLTPDRKPFYAGTYFPPQDGYGRPGFPRLLQTIHDAWIENSDDVQTSAEEITSQLASMADKLFANSDAINAITTDLSADAISKFEVLFDSEWGGFGGAPKFPSPSNLEFLLAHFSKPDSLPERERMVIEEMLKKTLHFMANGGMYDQLGGGFARYSVDESWLVPHFEKMLYDNSQLVRIYLHAFQLFNEPIYLQVVQETLSYLEREMLDPQGGFYSAQDADSEGIEGKYFVWTKQEVFNVLGADSEIFCEAMDITETGNFVDPHHPDLLNRSVISNRANLDDIALKFEMSTENLKKSLESSSQKLFEARCKRIPPGTDVKVLTSWNGLAMAAFAEAGRVLGEKHYITIAMNISDFIKRNLWKDGRLMHVWSADKPRIFGMLEDYAYLGLGLIELYKATGDVEQLLWAKELNIVLSDHFKDENELGFYDTPDDGEELLFRQRSYYDAAYPNANASAVQLGVWIDRYFNFSEGATLAHNFCEMLASRITESPSGFGSTLLLNEMLLEQNREVVIVGELSERYLFERLLAKSYFPWLVIATSDFPEPDLELFKDRQPPKEGAAVWLCEDMVCQLPVYTEKDFESQLSKLR